MLSNGKSNTGEQTPLVQSVAPASMGKACFLAVVGSLVCAWCILDSWQRDVSAQLFGLHQISDVNINERTGEVNANVSHPFNYPLTLAFFQFAFMGAVFFAIWALTARSPSKDVAGVRQNLSSPQFTGLVGTHVFSTFWLQSLMMPMQMMSPGMFAASRALQVPAAAGFRSQIMGARNGGHPLTTTAMMCGAAALIIYSQSMIAECLCIWSGHGIQLAGLALVIIYGLVLVIPAANAVCIESVTVDLEIHPFLMLAAMNICACLLCVPIMAFAHFAGWENVVQAFAVTTATREIYMMVLWLGVQMVLFSLVGVALITMLDSFWAVALTISFKAVFWWCGNIMHMYMSCPITAEYGFSVQHPNASLWGFIMLLGCVLVGFAAVTDSTPQEPRMAMKEKAELGGV